MDVQQTGEVVDLFQIDKIFKEKAKNLTNERVRGVTYTTDRAPGCRGCLCKTKNNINSNEHDNLIQLGPFMLVFAEPSAQ